MNCIRNKHANRLTAEQRIEAIQIYLDKDFPVGMAIFFAISKFLIAILAVGFQALAFHFKATYYFIAVGFWVAPFIILAEILLIYLVIKRTPKLLDVYTTFQLVANAVETSLVIVNVIAIFKTEPNTPAFDQLWIVYASLVLGVVLKVLRVASILMQTVGTRRAYRRLSHRLDEESGKRLITKVRL